MLASKMLLKTLKDTPQEAKIPSHILLLRAGMIKNEVSGVFNYLPLGLRVGFSTLFNINFLIC